jgi:TonB family protein
MGQSLQKLHAKKVLVADLVGPQGQAHPLGQWLADQLSETLSRDYPSLQVIHRPSARPFSSDEPAFIPSANNDVAKAQSAARDWAHRLGANAVITGVFGSVSQGVAIALSAQSSTGEGLMLAEEWGTVPVSDTITALSREPLPSVSPDVPAAGRNGFGTPECIYCPAPDYTDPARKDKLQGVVMLQLTVTADGRPTDIYVWKSLEGGLGAKAVKVIKTWKFKPALGPDGKPAAVTTLIEVTFRLY